jgi:RNase P subunit RPR2
MKLPDPTVLAYCPKCKKVAQYTEERVEIDGKKVVRRTCQACGKVTASPS